MIIIHKSIRIIDYEAQQVPHGKLLKRLMLMLLN